VHTHTHMCVHTQTYTHTYTHSHTYITFTHSCTVYTLTHALLSSHFPLTRDHLTLVSRLILVRASGVITGVGNQIGVGKESDIFVCTGPDPRDPEKERVYALKLHRYASHAIALLVGCFLTSFSQSSLVSFTHSNSRFPSLSRTLYFSLSLSTSLSLPHTLSLSHPLSHVLIHSLTLTHSLSLLFSLSLVSVRLHLRPDATAWVV
jgi:hypothetical protein